MSRTGSADQRFDFLPTLSIFSYYGETVQDLVPLEGTQLQETRKELVLDIVPQFQFFYRWPRQTFHVGYAWNLLHHFRNERLDGATHSVDASIEHEFTDRLKARIGGLFTQVYLLPQDRAAQPVGQTGLFENGYEDARELGFYLEPTYKVSRNVNVVLGYRYSRFRFVGEDRTDFLNRAYVPTGFLNTWALQVYRHGNYAVARRRLGAYAYLDTHKGRVEARWKMVPRLELRSGGSIEMTFLNEDERVLDATVWWALSGELAEDLLLNLTAEASGNLNTFRGVVGKQTLLFDPMDAYYQKVSFDCRYLLGDKIQLELSAFFANDTYRRVSDADVAIGGVYFQPVYYYNENVSAGISVGTFTAGRRHFDQYSFFVSYTWKGLSTL